MSRERKFHEFIEQQNREEKDAVWAKLQQKEAEREQEKPAPVLPRLTPSPFVFLAEMDADFGVVVCCRRDWRVCNVGIPFSERRKKE